MTDTQSRADELTCRLRALADAMENLLSAEPDMPTYADDYETASQELERARSALEA